MTFANHVAEAHNANISDNTTEFRNIDTQQTDVTRHVTCKVCDEDFGTKILLQAHTKQHPDCKTCDLLLYDLESLEEHNTIEHAYKCNTCGYSGRTETVLEKHILDKHIHSNRRGRFLCDECNTDYQSKDELWDHYSSTHKENTEEEENKEQPNLYNEENLKNELKNLKYNFLRLGGLLKNALNENENIKNDYEAKLLAANEQFRITKAENVELKGKVEILYKLSKSYIKRVNKVENESEDQENDPT